MEIQPAIFLQEFCEFCLRYAPKGVWFVAINSNETDNHPTD